MLIVQQTSISELIRRRSPDRPHISSVGQAATSPPSNLEQLKTTIAKLTASSTELEKTFVANKAKFLKLTTAPEATSKLTGTMFEEITALQRLLKKQTVDRLRLKKDLKRNQEHLLHFDKVEGRRWEDENVRLKEALEKTEKAWAGLGGEIQKVALLKELSKQEFATVKNDFESASGQPQATDRTPIVNLIR